MAAGLSFVAMAAALALVQDPEPGISRELARARKNLLSKVRYQLHFELDENRGFVEGRVHIAFTFDPETAPNQPIVVDFAGEALNIEQISGIPYEEPPRRANNHVILPAERFTRGENTFAATFRSKVASTGTPLTRYVDSADGKEYLYTLVVPADAHRLFPCFDQPDLKAQFRLRLTVPGTWVAVANGDEANDPARVEFPEVPRERGDSRRDYVFSETAPLSTYLFAFAAGPFAVQNGPPLHGGAPERMRLFHRDRRKSDIDAELLFGMHGDSVRWLEEYFDTPYPFGKLDIVALPGFPYGGMEHAGAIFYRESSLAFDRPPTESEKIRRSTLIYHEVSHQWFGNLVTMEWFDDLWLKEGFATFVGYRVLEALEPGKNAWLRFHQRVKPRAYAVDSTTGTTPVYQELENLADAKSAYGAIVYNKAPAVLRALQVRLGPERFRNGVRLFLRRHAFDNARWQDLRSALREASGLRGPRWSDRWILAAGMPRVTADWSVGDGKVDSFAIVQSGPPGAENQTWPLDLDVLVFEADGKQRQTRVRLDDARTTVDDFVGQKAPSAVLLNPTDVAYGLFLVDEQSRDYLLEHAPEIDDLLLRATAISALYNSVREAELDPRRYANLAIRLLAIERDPESHSWILGTLGTCLSRYIAQADTVPVRDAAAQLLVPQLTAGSPGLELQTLRFLAAHCRTDEVSALTRDVLSGDREIPGLALGRRDRFRLAASLLAGGDAEAVEREKARLTAGVDAAREIYLAEAAAPDSAVKERYFESYLNLDEPPEQWMSASLGYFHQPGQSAITLPYLSKALDRVDWVKQHRKIFFMPAWIDAFVNGHSSPEALATVQEFLDDRDDLEIDVRRKILQSLDGLERAVRIRARW